LCQHLRDGLTELSWLKMAHMLEQTAQTNMSR